MISGGVSAQDVEVVDATFETQNDGPDRIVLASKLRMLSQLIPSAACQVVSRYDPEYSGEILKAATDDFDHIIDGLEFGDENLGLYTAEERRLTIAAIHDVRDTWLPLHALVDHTMDGSITNEEMNLAFGESAALLGTTNALVVELVAQYSNPSQMAQAESFLIDLAGRQRMLIQEISKDACLMLHHNSEEESREELISTMSTFEATLDALLNGMASVGVRPPPTPQIADGLAKVVADYGEVRPMLQLLIDGNEISDDVASTKFRSLNDLMGTMNEVVGLYAAAVTN
jgi:hypothetical protein